MAGEKEEVEIKSPNMTTVGLRLNFIKTKTILIQLCARPFGSPNSLDTDTQISNWGRIYRKLILGISVLSNLTKYTAIVNKKLLRYGFLLINMENDSTTSLLATEAIKQPVSPFPSKDVKKVKILF